MFTWILGVIAVLFISLYIRARYKSFTTIRDLNLDLYHLEVEVKELKQGNFDLEESYEMVILDMNDQMTAIGELVLTLEAKITDRDQIIDHHATQCHGLVADTIDLLMDAIRPTHVDEEPEGVPADG